MADIVAILQAAYAPAAAFRAAQQLQADAVPLHAPFQQTPL